MIATGSLWRRLRGLLVRLRPHERARVRTEQALLCTIPFVLDHAAELWLATPGAPVRIDERGFADICERVPAEHAAQGLRYVGPLCTWRDLLDYVQRQPVEQKLWFRPQHGDRPVLSVELAVTPDQRLVVQFQPAPEQESLWDTQASAGAENWSRLVAVPRERSKT